MSLYLLPFPVMLMLHQFGALAHDSMGAMATNIVMVLAVTYLLLTRTQSPWDEPESVGTTAALETHKNKMGEQLQVEPHRPRRDRRTST